MSKKVTKTTKASKVTNTKTKKTVAKRKSTKVANVKKNVASAKKAVKKVIKAQAAKRKATKVVAKRKVTKKAVAKKKVTKKLSMKDKIFNQYKIVAGYSENLMQDVFSVVYRTKTLKRFINMNLANKYVEQEVLLRLNEKAVKAPAKIKGIQKELAAEFE